MSDAFVSVYEFRKRLEQHMLHARQPMVVSHGGMPIGYFIPAKVWHDRATVEVFNELISAILEMSGYDEADVKEAIESYTSANAEITRERMLRHLARVHPEAMQKTANIAKR